MQKWDSREMNGIFIGYCKELKAYIIFLLDSRMFIVSRDVKFVENKVW